MNPLASVSSRVPYHAIMSNPVLLLFINFSTHIAHPGRLLWLFKTSFFCVDRFFHHHHNTIQNRHLIRDSSANPRTSHVVHASLNLNPTSIVLAPVLLGFCLSSLLVCVASRCCASGIFCSYLSSHFSFKKNIS